MRLRALVLFAAVAELRTVTVPARSRQPVLITGMGIVRDASQHVLASSQRLSGSTEKRPVHVDEITSAATAAKVASLTSLPVGNTLDRTLATLPAEPTDAVVHCASRLGRSDARCATITPRIVIAATAAEARSDGSVVIYVSVIQWERASTTSPPGYTTLLRYVRAEDGTWRFDRVLGRAVG